MEFIIGAVVGILVWQSLGLFRPWHTLKYAVRDMFR